MNIAINALSSLQGGGQSYLLNLLRNAYKFPDIKIHVFCPPQFAHLYNFPGINVVRCHISSKNVLFRTIWERIKLPGIVKNMGIDLIFCPGGIINFHDLKDCLTAVTFQNMLIFDPYERRKYPLLSYMRFRLHLLKKLSRESFRKTNLLIFLSDHAKETIDRMIPERQGASALIPHGLDNVFRTAGKKDVPRHNFLPEDYLLYVSVLNVFKAQIEILHAYRMLCQKRDTKEKLLLVGSEFGPYGKRVRSEIKRLGLQNKVIITGPIPYDAMPSVYHHAKVHIYASSCENCPNIVIESLGSGRPLFISNRPPMPEIAGDAAMYFDPNKPEELTDLLLRYLDNEAWLNDMGNKAFERSHLYDWESTAEKTFGAFREVFESACKEK
ncbi:MAG: glycosyltransferase family 1 protein [Nitrospiraceae bacterium]|nr:MAG: glycosyltransferase family 1 protein [Nitrospiraceae bacterium]